MACLFCIIIQCLRSVFQQIYPYSRSDTYALYFCRNPEIYGSYAFYLFHQSDNLLCSICQILLCILIFHGLIQSYHSAEDREKGIDPCIVAGSCVTLYGTCKGDHFLPYFFASFATPTGAFPIAVCPSIRPSPVITRSASLI